MVTAPILIFPNWDQPFHVHVDASSIALGTVLAQPRDSEVDHPIAFAIRKLSNAKKNYTTIERGLTIVYALQKFRHYLLGSHFKFYTDHSTLKYLVNKPMLGGRICQWLLLFQEFDFEVIVKPGKQNVGPDHLSQIQSREGVGTIGGALPNAQLFRIEAMQDQFVEISMFLIIGRAPEHFTINQKKQLVTRSLDFQLIA